MERDEQQRLNRRTAEQEPRGSRLVMSQAVDQNDVQERVERHRDREHPEERGGALILRAKGDPDDQVREHGVEDREHQADRARGDQAVREQAPGAPPGRDRADTFGNSTVTIATGR